MITFNAACDHEGCKARGPEAPTREGAQETAQAAGWQRWTDPTDELRTARTTVAGLMTARRAETLDLCPEHRR